MQKHCNILTLILLSFFHQSDAKVHIIEPLSRSSKTAYNSTHIQNIYDEECKHIQINITNPHNAIELLSTLKPLAHKKITIKAPEHMKTVISWCTYVDKVITTGRTQCDVEIDIEDIVRINETMKKNNAQAAPYISIDESVSTLWHEVFVQDPNYKIGVCCQSLNHTKAPTMRIESFYPLACMQDVSVYTFDEVKAGHIPDHIHVYAFSEQVKKSITHIAGVLDQLDLVITTQPFIAQLCGALGKQAWYISSTNDYRHYTHIKHFAPSNETNIVFDMMHHLALSMEKPSAHIVSAEIATGELVDKMTILEIKTERISDEDKLENIWRELHTLRRTFEESIQTTPDLEHLISELKAANEALWETEDLIRDKEREKKFDDEFIHLARSVYIQNDERCHAKRKINELLGSRLVEEKSYKPYN